MKRIVVVSVLVLALLLIPIVAYAAAFTLIIPSTVTVTAPSGGGGGGGGGDTTSPTIADVSLCEVTETTACICWETNEMSDSQVEYWSSPSKLSPLDTQRVIHHRVHLTDLTPGTTYHYKTMSRDAAGNLAVSGELIFTTLGEVPAPPAPPTPTPPVLPAPTPPAPMLPVTPPLTPVVPILEPVISWPLVGGGIAAVIIVGFSVFFWVRRRRAV